MFDEPVEIPALGETMPEIVGRIAHWEPKRQEIEKLLKEAGSSHSARWTLITIYTNQKK